jgi:cytochrome c oxidase cbb3-type subunit 4
MGLYSILREFADSWGLLALVFVFLGVVAFVFRPGSRAVHDDIANIPLRNDALPESDSDRAAGEQP